MRVVVKKVNQKPEVREIKNKLEVFQEIVGGSIEPFVVGEGIIGWCDEDGKLKNLQPNFLYLNDVICGDVFFSSAKGEDITGLTDEQINILFEVFKEENQNKDMNES